MRVKCGFVPPYGRWHVGAGLSWSAGSVMFQIGVGRVFEVELRWGLS